MSADAFDNQTKLYNFTYVKLTSTPAWKALPSVSRERNKEAAMWRKLRRENPKAARIVWRRSKEAIQAVKERMADAIFSGSAETKEALK